MLVRLLRRDEQLFLDEIRDELLIRTGKDVSLATVCRGLREAGYTSLKVCWPDSWPLACGLCLRRHLAEPHEHILPRCIMGTLTFYTNELTR